MRAVAKRHVFYPALRRLGRSHPGGNENFEGILVLLSGVRVLPGERSGRSSPELIAAAVPLVPLVRRGRPIWESEPTARRASVGRVPEARRIRWP
jgi:hypothetical protein